MITGTWEQICQHQSKFQGQRVSVTILREPEAADWMLEYAPKLKNRTPEEIEAACAEIARKEQLRMVFPPGKTAQDVWDELCLEAAEERRTPEENKILRERALTAIYPNPYPATIKIWDAIVKTYSDTDVGDWDELLTPAEDAELMTLWD